MEECEDFHSERSKHKVVVEIRAIWINCASNVLEMAKYRFDESNRFHNKCSLYFFHNIDWKLRKKNRKKVIGFGD